MSRQFTSADVAVVVGKLYDGVTDHEAMSCAFDEIGQRAGVLVSAAERLNLATGTFTTLVQSGPDPSHPGFALLDDRARAINPYYKPDVLTRLMGKAQFANDVISRSRVRSSDYYKEYLQPLDVSDIAGYFFQEEPGTITCLSFPKDGGRSYGGRARDFFHQLTPHVFRAFELRYRLEAAARQKRMFEGALDRHVNGILLIDRAGRVFWNNASAAELLAKRDGLSLADEGFSLVETDHDKVFQALLRQQMAACSLNPKLTKPLFHYIPAGSRSTPYAIGVYPAAFCDSAGDPESAAVCVVIVDPTRKHKVTQEQLIRQFLLTRAEAAIALKVSLGLDLDSVADESGQKVTTTRNLLKRAMRKIDVHRQSELAAKVWSVSLPIRSDG